MNRDVSPSKHLSAAPLGHSTGHGLSPLSKKAMRAAAGGSGGALSSSGAAASMGGSAAETCNSPSSKGSFRTQTQQVKLNSSVRVESGKRNVF